jgi:F-type H+-transporting ATPase subunit a
MPEHTSFLSYLAARLFANWDHNVAAWDCHEHWDKAKCSAFGAKVTSHSFEPLLASITIMLLVLIFAVITRSKIQNVDKAVVPEARLTIRTTLEVLVETFYNMMKEMMGTKRAKRYLPLIGTCACFIFFSNIASLIPGFSPPTSNLNITLGCALIVFVAYHYYGLRENGVGYIKHFMGPILVLAPLIFVIEVISNCIRPITLAVRLMLNMAVDHLVLGIVLALLPLVVPLPLMMLGTLVAIVQTLVFCLLSSIYVSMATEHDH